MKAQPIDVLLDRVMAQRDLLREEVATLRDINAELLAACKAMRETMYSDKSRQSIMADAAIANADAQK
jgi:hypothetical protein